MKDYKNYVEPEYSIGWREGHNNAIDLLRNFSDGKLLMAADWLEWTQKWLPEPNTLKLQNECLIRARKGAGK